MFHLAFPPRLVAMPDGSTRYATVEQDTPEHKAGRVEALLRTPLGWVDSQPDLGITDLTFRQQPDLGQAREMLDRFDPDAAAVVTPDEATLAEQIQNVTVEIP